MLMLFRSLGEGVVTELQVPDGHGIGREDTGDRSGTVPRHHNLYLPFQMQF